MPNQQHPSFPYKAWTATAIVAFVAVMLLVFWAAFNVLLLILAGTLIALFFTGLAGIIRRKSHWNEKVCVAIAILGTMLLVAALFWLIGAKVAAQSGELADILPQTLDNAKEKVRELPGGDRILERLSSKSAMDKGRTLATHFFKSTFGVLGDLYAVLFIGVFFSVSSRKYLGGIVSLIPARGRKKGREVLGALGSQLRGWLKGKLFSMLVVAILTAIGLAAMGVRMWLVLALLAGLISFIPNFGPLIALIPAVLVALLDGPGQAAMVVGLYIVVQFVESNFITPLAQQKLISMPPALIMIAQLIMGALSGGWGLVLATPLTVIAIVLVKRLYIDSQEDGGQQPVVNEPKTAN